MRPSRITTTASGSGAAPVPSTTVAPVRANAGGGVAGSAGKAVVTATRHPSDVRTSTRSLTPRTSASPCTNRYRYAPYATPSASGVSAKWLATRVSGQASPAASAKDSKPNSSPAVPARVSRGERR